MHSNTRTLALFVSPPTFIRNDVAKLMQLRYVLAAGILPIDHISGGGVKWFPRLHLYKSPVLAYYAICSFVDGGYVQRTTSLPGEGIYACVHLIKKQICIHSYK